jgi:hypothetical protein
MIRRSEMDPGFAVALRSVLTEQVRDSRPAVPGPRRRLAKSLTAGLVIVGATAGVAVASDRIREAFGWSQGHEIAADYKTGRLLFTTTGPDGGPMQVYAADNIAGGKCYSVLMPQRPQGQRLADASCGSREWPRSNKPLRLEVGAGATSESEGFFLIHAPGADYVTLSDGQQTRRIPAAADTSAGWVTADDFDRPLTLTSYSASGTVIDQYKFSVPSIDSQPGPGHNTDGEPGPEG